MRRTVEALGAKVVAERFFPDHHAFRREDLAGLAELAPRWITTEKDAVKLRPSWVSGFDLEVLSIELEVEGPDRPARLDRDASALVARSGVRPGV